VRTEVLIIEAKPVISEKSPFLSIQSEQSK